MSKIFINYRRDDSAANAGRLYDRLASHFDPDHLFMDIDQIAPGDDFIEVIHEKLRSVQVAVVLIGKHWLDMTDASGRRRLDNPDDFVRLEIVTLLERKIRVIPVLVGGAVMPESSQLPECLAPLTRRHAYVISDNRFHTDVDKLIQVLEKAMGVQTPSPPPVRPDSPKIPFAAILGVLVILLAAFGLFHYSPWILQETGTQRSQLLAPEPEKWVAKQSTVELPSETSSSTAKSFVIAEQPTEIKPPVKKKLVVEQSIEEKSLPTEQPAVKQPSKTKFPFEPEMVRIPPGKFLMGSVDAGDREKPQHEVIIAYAFEIGKYEVTFDEYDAFANATSRKLPDDRGWGRGKRPVINISFNDAEAYVQWLSNKTGKQYRLPSEAEWEYVARAGTQTEYWWGNDIGKNNAVCSSCGSQWDSKQTAPVGSFKPNAFGLYDTAGNVWELTQDCWHDNYQNAPNDGFAWTDINGGECNDRVVRGGSWILGPQYLRSAYRLSLNSGEAIFDVGFRIARAF